MRGMRNVRRRRTSQNFGILIVPVVCFAVSAYFGYAGIFGQRGLIARNDTQAELALKQRELAQVQGQREALQHRTELLDSRALDPDMLDEVARTVLTEGRTGEVAVRRPAPPAR